MSQAEELVAKTCRGLERMRVVIEALDERDFAISTDPGWGVAVTLVHLAFYDDWVTERWRRYLAAGLFEDLPDEITDLVNAAGSRSWQAVTPNHARKLALQAAEEVADLIGKLPSTAMGDAIATGRPAMVDRSLHWGPHLDRIQALLSDDRHAPSSIPGGLVVRPATAKDTDEVLRLADLMYEAMGMDTSAPGWRKAAARMVETRLGTDAIVFVADDPNTAGQLVATGAGTIARRLPGPSNPDVQVGYIQWVSTDPKWRRLGLARSITTALLEWFQARGVRSVELHATADTENLYRSLGFGQGTNPGLRIRL
jgi:ribosomal protein S18 acetylase RimI-like enzyme